MFEMAQINGEMHMIPEEINPFSLAGDDDKKKDEFVRDMLEVLYPKEFHSTKEKPLTIEGIPLAYRIKVFREEIFSFVEKHSGCGHTCPHLMRFYERKGFFKSLNFYKNMRVVKMPKVAVGEDNTTTKELKKKKKMDSVRQWVVQYKNFPSKVSVLKL